MVKKRGFVIKSTGSVEFICRGSRGPLSLPTVKNENHENHENHEKP